MDCNDMCKGDNSYMKIWPLKLELWDSVAGSIAIVDLDSPYAKVSERYQPPHNEILQAYLIFAKAVCSDSTLSRATLKSATTIPDVTQR